MPPRSVNSICPVITVAEHLNRILAMVPVLEVEKAGLPEARGRFLASPVTAAIPVPPWTNSAMDGYAVRFDDLAGASQQSPVTLRVVGDLPAGTGEDPAIGPGEAVRIMTGAPVPAAADTVIPQEMTDGGLEEVRCKGHSPEHIGTLAERPLGTNPAASCFLRPPSDQGRLGQAGASG